jgi:hypothetical protein
MKKLNIAALLLWPFLAIAAAHADASLVFNPAQTSFQFDAGGNLSFGLVPSGLDSSAKCQLKFVLARKQGPLNQGKIKNAAAAPEGALFLFSTPTPAGAPNTALTATTTGLASVPKKGSIYGRAALRCSVQVLTPTGKNGVGHGGGKSKVVYVFSPIVSFDFSLMTGAAKKSAPNVGKEWKSKTVTTFQ